MYNTKINYTTNEAMNVTDDALELYLSTAPVDDLELEELPETIALLTKEEERELGKTISEGGPAAKAAKDKLVESNMRLAKYFANKYRSSGVELEDLVQMACEGLIIAASKYDYRLDKKFSTYASWWIRQCIQRGIGETRPIHMPENVYTIMRKVNKAKKEFMKNFNQEPTIEELAEFTALSEKEVQKAITAAYSIVSLDAKLGEDEDFTYSDLLPDENAVDPCEFVVDKMMRENVQEVLGMLSPKEAKVLELFYGIGTEEPHTLEAVSKLSGLNISREYVRQIELKARKKIRRSPSMRDKLIDVR